MLLFISVSVIIVSLFPLLQGVGELPSESAPSKHAGGSGQNSRHSTGGPIRVPNQSGSSRRNSVQLDQHDGSPGSSHHSSNSISPKSSSSKAKKHQSYHESSSVPAPLVHDVPLPDGLLERLKASNWSERYEAISDLEAFVNAHPIAMAPHLHKVRTVTNNTMVFGGEGRVKL